jgi:hypothetical protein
MQPSLEHTLQPSLQSLQPALEPSQQPAMRPSLQDYVQPILDMKPAQQKPLRNRSLRKTKNSDVPPAAPLTYDVPTMERAFVLQHTDSPALPTSPSATLQQVGKPDLWDAPIPLENTFVHFRENPSNFGVFRKAKSEEVP